MADVCVTDCDDSPLSCAAILEGGIDDFGTTAELYEAIGGMLEGLDNEKSQEDAEDVCRQLFNLMIK